MCRRFDPGPAHFHQLSSLTAVRLARWLLLRQVCSVEICLVGLLDLAPAGVKLSQLLLELDSPRYRVWDCFRMCGDVLISRGQHALSFFEFTLAHQQVAELDAAVGRAIVIC